MARLIDADAIKYEVKTYGGWGRPEEYVKKQYIDRMPTVDAVEVVHGRWVLHEDGSGTCTNCRRRTKGCWDYDSFYRHCPNCGAQMDLEVE